MRSRVPYPARAMRAMTGASIELKSPDIERMLVLHFMVTGRDPYTCHVITNIICEDVRDHLTNIGKADDEMHFRDILSGLLASCTPATTIRTVSDHRGTSLTPDRSLGLLTPAEVRNVTHSGNTQRDGAAVFATRDITKGTPLFLVCGPFIHNVTNQKGKHIWLHEYPDGKIGGATNAASLSSLLLADPNGNNNLCVYSVGDSPESEVFMLTASQYITAGDHLTVSFGPLWTSADPGISHVHEGVPDPFRSVHSGWDPLYALKIKCLHGLIDNTTTLQALSDHAWHHMHEYEDANHTVPLYAFVAQVMLDCTEKSTKKIQDSLHHVSAWCGDNLPLQDLPYWQYQISQAHKYNCNLNTKAVSTITAGLLAKSRAYLPQLQQTVETQQSHQHQIDTLQKELYKKVQEEKQLRRQLDEVWAMFHNSVARNNKYKTKTEKLESKITKLKRKISRAQHELE